MAHRTKLTESERNALAAAAAQRYRDGESWAQIAQDYDLTSAYVRRLTTAHHTINYRRWGQRPTASVDEATRLRTEGCQVPGFVEGVRVMVAQAAVAV